MTTTIGGLVVGDSPAAWRAAGFTVVAATVVVGELRIRLVGDADARGVLAWSLTGVTSEAVAALDASEGLTTYVVEPELVTPAEHPLGVTDVDHLVLMTPDLARTTTALEGLGLDVRRVRDFEVAGAPMQQVFFRLGRVILEVVGAPGVAAEGPASFWGITFGVADIDAAAAALGEHAGRVKDAVQPGRRITTVRGRALGLSPAIALMTPQPPRA